MISGLSWDFVGDGSIGKMSNFLFCPNERHSMNLERCIGAAPLTRITLAHSM